MVRRDTSIGGIDRAFPETVWSGVLTAPDPDSPERRRRLDQLATRYWRPVYAYLRRLGRHDVEDAKDLTQEFFCRVMTGDFIQRFEPERGRFRHFLKAALKNFLADTYRAGARLKRGGGRRELSLDVEGFESTAGLADERQDSPDEIFDRQWADEVMAQGLLALKEELLGDGKDLYWRAYELAALEPDPNRRPTYESIAATLGIRTTDVTNYLNHARSRLRAHLVRVIADTVDGRVAAVDELKDLLAD